MDKFREMLLVNLEGSNLHKRRPRNVAKVHTAVVAKQRKKVLRQAAKKRKAEAIASQAPKRKARKNIPEVATAVAPAPEEAASKMQRLQEEKAKLKKELATNKLEARKQMWQLEALAKVEGSEALAEIIEDKQPVEPDTTLVDKEPQHVQPKDGGTPTEKIRSEKEMVKEYLQVLQKNTEQLQNNISVQLRSSLSLTLFKMAGQLDP